MNEKRRNLKNFNLQIIYGEIGSFFGIQISSLIGKIFTSNSDLLSWIFILGSIIGGSSAFLITRINYEKKQNKFSYKKLIKDISYYTPVASIIGLFVYYPILKLTSLFLLNKGFFISVSALLSQVVAFLFSLLALNIYRELLRRKIGREL